VQPRRAQNPEKEAQEPGTTEPRAQKEPTGATRNTEPKNAEPGTPKPRAPKRPNQEPQTEPTTEAKGNQGQPNRQNQKGAPREHQGSRTRVWRRARAPETNKFTIPHVQNGIYCSTDEGQATTKTRMSYKCVILVVGNATRQHPMCRVLA